MAKVVVTGAAGFLGRLLIHKLLALGSIRVRGWDEEIEQLVAVDLETDIPSASDPRVLVLKGSLQDVLYDRPSIVLNATVIFHLASAVSAECEADFDLGLQSNLMTGINLGNLLRRSEVDPILVFASSLAVYGAEQHQTLPKLIRDDVRPTPQNSYGAQKLILETYFADIARRGELSVRTVRLMTVSVRSGQSNGAASGFLSGMIREPLHGRPCNVPVPVDLNVCLNAPEQAVSGLISSCGIEDAQWGPSLGMNLPGMVVSVGEMIDALREVGGVEALKHLTFDEEPGIASIVSAWPSHFESQRAEELGFQNKLCFVDVVRAFALNEVYH